MMRLSQNLDKLAERGREPAFDLFDTTCPATGRPCRMGCFNVGAKGENCRITEATCRQEN